MAILTLRSSLDPRAKKARQNLYMLEVDSMAGRGRRDSRPLPAVLPSLAKSAAARGRFAWLEQGGTAVSSLGLEHESRFRKTPR